MIQCINARPFTSTQSAVTEFERTEMYYIQYSCSSYCQLRYFREISVNYFRRVVWFEFPALAWSIDNVRPQTESTTAALAKVAEAEQYRLLLSHDSRLRDVRPGRDPRGGGRRGRQRAGRDLRANQVLRRQELPHAGECQ